MNDRDLHALIGALVRSYRKERGMTQQQLSDKLIGINRSTIANLESGRFTTTISTLHEIAKALGVEVRDLLP